MGRPGVIAIDGPAGAGKSATARGLALRLGYVYVDTGALYRSIALFAQKTGIDFEDAHALAEMTRQLDFRFTRTRDDLTGIVVNSEDVSDQIRTPEITRGSSIVSRHREVREELLLIQRKMAAAGGVVMEGRDIGSVVLPDADVKVFITARPEIRAGRRHKEMIEKGFEVSIEEVLSEIEARDERDMHRAVSPLKPADDAWILDTSDLSLEDVIEKIAAMVKA